MAAPGVSKAQAGWVFIYCEPRSKRGEELALRPGCLFCVVVFVFVFVDLRSPLTRCLSAVGKGKGDFFSYFFFFILSAFFMIWKVAATGNHRCGGGGTAGAGSARSLLFKNSFLYFYLGHPCFNGVVSEI